jgi:hypothetical protein
MFKHRKVVSMVGQEELHEIFKEMLMQNKIEQDMNMNIVNKAEFNLKKLLY